MAISREKGAIGCMIDNILEVRDLTVQFERGKRLLTAVDGLNLNVRKNEILGLVGESGSGKTQSMLAVMRLTQEPGRISSGRILFQGEDLMLKKPGEMSEIRGGRISMIFQDPMSALDPVYSCGHQMMETLLRHEKIPRKQALERCKDMLHQVGLNNPEKIMHSYPFQLSGGMCQRVMIAMALLCSPELLIADEPTTALDVTVQAQILDLLMKMREERNMSIVLITHDLAVVSEATDRVAILYAGSLMEEAPTRKLIRNPEHPYTQGLIRSVVHLDMQPEDKLHIIPGVVPDLKDIPIGCVFSTRCPYADAQCIAARPSCRESGPGHAVYCLKNTMEGGCLHG